MGKKGSLKGKSRTKLNEVVGYINKNNQIQRFPIRTDITRQGDLVTLQTMNGNEIGMVMCHIKKNQLRDYLRNLNVKFDESSEIWRCNYSVIGHYKAVDIDEYILSGNDMAKYPRINILIVKVNSKTNYNLIVGRSPEMLLLIDTIKHISLEDKEIPELMTKLLNTSVMGLATKDMSKTYQKELEKKRLEEQEEKSVEKNSSEETEQLSG